MIPKVNSFNSESERNFLFDISQVAICLEDFDAECYKVFVERLNIELVEECDNKIIVNKVDDLKEEEYLLEIKENEIIISASTTNAVIYGFSTLYQLIMKDHHLPISSIQDEPRYSHRALSFDCVRHFFTSEEVKKIIEQMSIVKLNTFHWHLTDDQGWRIESKKFPKLHENNEYYTQEEIKEVVAYARERGIEVVPEMDMPGHMTGLLTAYPEYSCSGKEVSYAVTGGIYPIILCAGKESTYAFVDEILEEVCSLFPSSRFHIGGDEAPKKEWMKCPHCNKKLQENNLKDMHELQGYFSNRINQLLKKYHKTAITWNDSLQADNLEKDIAIQFWSVQYAEEFKKLAEKKGKFIYSDMFTFYFDYPSSMSPLKRVYEENPVIEGVDYSSSESLLGIEACMWTEHIETNEELELRIFPRLYAFAENAWSKERNYEDFENRLAGFLQNCHPSDVGCLSEESWNPKGKARQAETFSYLKSLTANMSEEVRAETTEAAAPNELFNRKFVTSFFDPVEDREILAQMM